MFAPFRQSPRNDPAAGEFDRAFVRETRVEHPREARSRRSEWVLAIGWALVVVKCLAVFWACRTYAVPIGPWWIAGPTLVFAALCTLIYWRRH